jgi:glycerol-3-phosphate cytidylyltransferase
MAQKKFQTVITFGTFDLFHVGHLRLLQRAKELGGRLVVGVSSDALNVAKKTKQPIIPQQHRMEIVRGVAGVDEVFLEETLELKPFYIRNYDADVLVMGDDWEGKFDGLRDLCRVVYVERTHNVSTSHLLDYIVNR